MPTRTSDALGAMYFVAAVLMGLGAIAVIVLMFVPSDFLSRSEDAYVPAAPTERAGPPAPPAEAPPEELHMH